MFDLRTSFKVFSLSLLIIIQYSQSFSQWEKISSNRMGIDLHDICVEGDLIIDVGYKVTSTEGIKGFVVMSKDKGANFDEIEFGNMLLYTVCFADEMNGFIGGYKDMGVLFRTTDGGGTWSQQTLDGNTTGIIDIQFLDSKIGYACGYGYTRFTDGNVYKTTDGGNKWKSISGNITGLPIDKAIL